MRRTRRNASRKNKSRRNKSRRYNGGAEKKEIILFHADWCGFCKDFMSTWDSLKNKLKGGAIEMREVEASKLNEELPKIKEKVGGQNIEISGYPTLAKIQGGKLSLFKGDRTEEKVEAWIKK